jgi:hypothetical protein
MKNLAKGSLFVKGKRIDVNTFMLSLIAAISSKQVFVPDGATPALSLTSIISTGSLYGAGVGSEILSRFTKQVDQKGVVVAYPPAQLESSSVAVYKAVRASGAYTVTPYAHYTNSAQLILQQYAAGGEPGILTPALASALTAAQLLQFSDPFVDANGGMNTIPTAASVKALEPAGTVDGTYFIGRHSNRVRQLGRISGSVNFSLLRQLGVALASMAWLPQGAALAPVVAKFVEGFLAGDDTPLITTAPLATVDPLGG